MCGSAIVIFTLHEELVCADSKSGQFTGQRRYTRTGTGPGIAFVAGSTIFYYHRNPRSFDIYIGGHLLGSIDALAIPILVFCQDSGFGFN